MVKENTGWWQNLKNAVSKAYEGIVSKLPNPFAGLTAQLNQKENPDHVKLQAVRQSHYQLIAQEAQKSAPNYNNLTKQITADTKKYVQTILDEEVKKLGTPPCEFTIFTLGSLARQETGPITDLEIGIILEKKTVETYRYFSQLSQNVSDRVFLLGEHPAIGGKGLRMDEAGNSPPHKAFFGRNATHQQEKQLLNEAISNKEWDKIPYEGSRPFLATAEEFASFTKAGKFQQDNTTKKALNELRERTYNQEFAKAKNDPKNTKPENQLKSEIGNLVNQMYRPYSTKELNIANDAGKRLGRNMAHLYGSPSLYQRLITEKQKYLNEPATEGTYRQQMAKDFMISDVKDTIQKGKGMYATGELGKSMDIKRELYRFTEQFMTNLGFYYQCQSQNPIEIINELIGRAVLSTDLGAKITDFIEFAASLRLKEQSLLKRQGFAAYFDEEEFNKDKKDFEEKIQNLEKAIAYLQVSNKSDPAIATKKRELFALNEKYHHMLDMAPNTLYNEKEVKLLREKYAPLAKEIFQAAQKWTQEHHKLGFAETANQKTSDVGIAKARAARAVRVVKAAQVIKRQATNAVRVAKTQVAKVAQQIPVPPKRPVAKPVVVPKPAAPKRPVAKPVVAPKPAAPKRPVAKPVVVPKPVTPKQPVAINANEQVMAALRRVAPR